MITGTSLLCSHRLDLFKRASGKEPKAAAGDPDTDPALLPLNLYDSAAMAK
jgi:hypothetical protein